MHVVPFGSPKTPLPLRDLVLVEILIFVATQSVLFFAARHEAGHAPGWLLETGCYAIVATALVLAAIRYAHRAYRAYKSVCAAHVELRGQVDRVSAVAAERERTAREMQTILGRELTSLAMQIEVARRLVSAELSAGDTWENHPANVHLSRAHAMTLQTLGHVRRAVRRGSDGAPERGRTRPAVPFLGS